MAINAYVGLPGSGKSYTVVKHVVLAALEARRVLVTNLPLKLDVIREDYPDADIRPFDIEKFVELREAYAAAGRDVERRAEINARIQAEIDADVPAGCVLALDEAWRLWPAAGGRKDTAPAFQSLLAEHRHRVDERGSSMSVVLATQDLNQVASWARALVAMTYRTVNMGHLGMSKRYRVDIYQGAVTGNKPPKSAMLRQSTGKYEAKFYRYYDSHTMRKGEGSGADEKPMDARGSLWASPIWSIGLPLVVVLFAVAVWRVWVFFHPEPAAAANGAPAGAVATGGVRSRGGVSAPPVGRWWIDGFLEFADAPERSLVFLTDGTWRVALPLERNCQRFAEGWLSCRYRGEVATNELQRVAAEAPRASVATIFDQGL